VNHEIVTPRHGYGDSVAGSERSRVDGPHVSREQATTPLSLVNRGYAKGFELFDQVKRRSFDLAYANGIVHRNTSIRVNVSIYHSQLQGGVARFAETL
jgi:hypothetical protein